MPVFERTECKQLPTAPPTLCQARLLDTLLAQAHQQLHTRYLLSSPAAAYPLLPIITSSCIPATSYHHQQLHTCYLLSSPAAAYLLLPIITSSCIPATSYHHQQLHTRYFLSSPAAAYPLLPIITCQQYATRHATNNINCMTHATQSHQIVTKRAI
jgi:hypothetical protein